MEPLRVLELYSGIGGMHHALRGERTDSFSCFHSGPQVPALAPRRGGAAGRDLVRPTSVALETTLVCLPGPPLQAETPLLWPQALEPEQAGAPWYCLRGSIPVQPNEPKLLQTKLRQGASPLPNAKTQILGLLSLSLEEVTKAGRGGLEQGHNYSSR